MALITLIKCWRDSIKNKSYFEGYKDGYKKGFRNNLEKDIIEED